MAIYKINTQTFKISELNEYNFRSEEIGRISPQELIATCPSIVLSLPELEIPPSNSILVLREFNTSRGSIDILLITENSDVVLIETKLYRNPESHRTVVAQAIDYTKALTEIDLETIKSYLLQSRYTNNKLTEDLFNRDDFCFTLKRNIQTGNFKVLIIGDKIHSNILVSCQS